METNNEIPMNEPTMFCLIEQFRKSYAVNLNNFLKIIKFSDLLKKNKGKDSQLKEQSYHDILPLYDEKGKISWEIIRMHMLSDIEKYIKSEYNTLHENEIRLCCLLIFDVPTKHILNILNYNQKSIYSTSFTIKQKAGVKEITEIFGKIILKRISIDE